MPRSLSLVVASLALLLSTLPAWGAKSKPDDSSTPTTATVDGTTAPESNHDQVVRAWGVHFFGAPELEALAADSTGAPIPGTLSVPTFGLRRWYTPGIGLDVGLGVGYSSQSQSGAMGGLPTNYAGGAIVGVPLDILALKYFNFFFEPGLSLYYGSGSYTANKTDYSFSTTVITVSGNLVTEVHLGFFGLPNVSVELATGLRFQNLDQTLSIGTGSVTQTERTLGTNNLANLSLHSLWDTVLGVTYYFW
jgi:hypothetical protein